jgi:hypothetical protein
MGCFSRRSFLKEFLLGTILPLVSPFLGRISSAPGRLALSEAGASGEQDIISAFRGEALRYQIEFLWFTPAATGSILFEEEKGNRGYKAILEGRTSGLIGWLTRYRRDIYTSYMEVSDGGRLKPLRFEEDVVIGEKVRKKVYRFDYRAGKLIRRRMNRRGVFIRSEQVIPEGVVYDDFLTAFYNFRLGVYGKIQRGRRYRVRTIPKKGVSTIDVEIATREEEMRRRQRAGDKRLGEYYVRVFLDKEITKSKTGKVEGWASRDLVPIEGTIEDVVLFGDVHGVLVGEKRPS